MAHRAFPVIIQLLVTYLVVSFIVRAIRRARKASSPDEQRPSQHTPPRASGEPGDDLEASRVWREAPGVERPHPSPPAPRRQSSSPRPGGFRREERMFNGVVWQMVHRPRRDLSEGAGSRAAGDEVYVEEPPRCPKCGLGVLETHSWLGYTWACPECGTRARSSMSIEDVARMLAHRH